LIEERSSATCCSTYFPSIKQEIEAIETEFQELPPLLPLPTSVSLSRPETPKPSLKLQVAVPFEPSLKKEKQVKILIKGIKAMKGKKATKSLSSGRRKGRATKANREKNNATRPPPGTFKRLDVPPELRLIWDQVCTFLCVSVFVCFFG
jgi:hypothetical protein